MVFANSRCRVRQSEAEALAKVRLRLRFRLGRVGAAAVELAVLLPFLSLLFVGVLDFCRILYYAQTLQNAARCGALYAGGAVPAAPGTSSQAAAVQAALAES